MGKVIYYSDLIEKIFSKSLEESLTYKQSRALIKLGEWFKEEVRQEELNNIVQIK